MRADFRNAYFIKLGRGGQWEESSIRDNIMRIGWSGQSLADINGQEWDHIHRQIGEEVKARGTRAAKDIASGTTRDLNALKTIVQSTPDDIWITFHNLGLWWCRVSENSHIYKDKISKFRRLSQRWSNKDVQGNPLLVSEISGSLTKTQGFRATVCSIKEPEVLRRLLNCEMSPDFERIRDGREALAKSVAEGVHHLHWKDFETLVDLLSRQAGWRRLGTLGQTQKFVDMELEEPINRERYQVQVKAKATRADFEKYAEDFSEGSARKLFFVVHSPTKDLLELRHKYRNIELILPDRLGEMVVDLGLASWIMRKIR